MKISELPISNPDRNGYRQVFGIRYDEREFAPGDVVPHSYHWIDGEPTDDPIDGTCTIRYDNGRFYMDDDYADIEIDDIREFARNYNYYGSAYLVEGKSNGGGDDRDEVILEDPVVLCKLF